MRQKDTDLEQEKLRKLDAKSLKAARDTDEEIQKEIRKFERAKTATANKAIKAAKSTAYQAKQAASKAIKSGPI